MKLAQAWDLVGPSGKRYKRFAVLIEKGVIKYVGVDEQGVKVGSFPERRVFEGIWNGTDLDRTPLRRLFWLRCKYGLRNEGDKG